jgi:hypothetical protein
MAWSMSRSSCDDKRVASKDVMPRRESATCMVLAVDSRRRLTYDVTETELKSNELVMVTSALSHAQTRRRQNEKRGGCPRQRSAPRPGKDVARSRDGGRLATHPQQGSSGCGPKPLGVGGTATAALSPIAKEPEKVSERSDASGSDVVDFLLGLVGFVARLYGDL